MVDYSALIKSLQGTMTTYALAKRVGMSESALGKVVNGQTKTPRRKNLLAMADAFGIDRDAFLDGRVVRLSASGMSIDDLPDTVRLPLDLPGDTFDVVAASASVARRTQTEVVRIALAEWAEKQANTPGIRDALEGVRKARERDSDP